MFGNSFHGVAFRDDTLLLSLASKHQARKHPNAESKVTKILRQDSEQQQHLSFERHDYEDNDDDHEEEEEADDDEDVDDHGPQNMNLIKKLKKLKGAEKVDIQQQQQHAARLASLGSLEFRSCPSVPMQLVPSARNLQVGGRTTHPCEAS